MVHKLANCEVITVNGIAIDLQAFELANALFIQNGSICFGTAYCGAGVPYRSPSADIDLALSKTLQTTDEEG